MPDLFRLSAATILDLVGDDAPAILHNLTTNDVISLAVGAGAETFITDVRGKMLGHFVAFRTRDGYRMIGAPGQATAVAQHCDRYTIREDASPVDLSSDLTIYVVGPEAPSVLRDETDWAQSNAEVYDTDWLGPETIVLVTETPGAVEQVLRAIGLTAGDDQEFHQARVRAGFPWYGVDLSEKNLPQEASRIEQSISFTKGCYLGQETVARLDALGQVQKQLVRWSIEGSPATAGAEVSSDGKVVGRLTSIADTDDGKQIAIGMTRRSHFDPGSTADGDGFVATVVA